MITAEEYLLKEIKRIMSIDYKNAIKHYNQAITQNPQFVEAFESRGYVE